jgi:1-phosphofructokinase
MSGAPIITLTPAPTLDRTYFVHNLIEGGVNRADSVSEELAGKGINVTRGLYLSGVKAPGVVPIGNSDPGVFARTGSMEQFIPHWVDGTLRVSTTIVEKDGPTTKVNEAPRPLSDTDWKEVVSLTISKVKENSAKWLVIAGALPVDKGTNRFVDLEPLFMAMRDLGVRVAMDSSGEPLKLYATKGLPSVIKPNAHELAETVGRDLHTVGDVIDAARELCHHGIECVLASLGPDGMVAVTKDRAWKAKTPPVKVINTVGAGDATLAGFLTAVTTNPVTSDEEFGVGFNVAIGVQNAVQYGAVAVTQPTSGLENLDNMPIAEVSENPDRNVPLEEIAYAAPAK